MSYGQSSYLCGCGYYVGHTKRYLPQVQLDAHTTILSNTSRTTLKQTFTNPTSYDVKQCLYTFPLYDGVSVVAFDCRIGSRVLRGVVKERSQAKATFDQAVSRGETAGYLEQSLDASDVFSTHLGNIPANETIHVEITYVGELKHDAEADGIRFTIPTRIAPRYGSAPSAHSSTEASAQKRSGISIIVDASVAEGSFIRGIQSPSHPIAVTMGSTSTSSDAEVALHKASATLSLGTTELDQDFVLLVLTKDTGTPKAILESHPTLANQRALMLTLVPKFSLPRSNPEIVFVADRSGSMEYNIPTLKSALKVFLKSLPVGVRFNICSFGSRNSFLWPKSQAYSRESLDKALAHVDTFRANYGGTEIFDALKDTISNRHGDIPCEVMLLTDGEIWDQNRLFTYLNGAVRERKASLRLFALGVGDDASHSLVEGVARAGNGFAQTVKNNEKLDSKVIRMLKGALSPHTTDYSLEIKYDDQGAHEDDFELVEKVTDSLKVLLSDTKTPTESEAKEETKPISFFGEAPGKAGPEKPPSADNATTDPFGHLPTISIPKILQTPQAIPPLYPFSRASVYLLFFDESHKIPKSVTLRAKSEYGPLELDIPVEVLSSPGQTIHQLAARKAILELEEGRGWIYEAKHTNDAERLVKECYPGRFDEMVQREAVRLGVRFQVGGKWSSFVAVQANEDGSEGEEVGTSEPPVESASICRSAGDSDEDMGFGLIDTVPAPKQVSKTGGGTGTFSSFDVIDYSDDDEGFQTCGLGAPTRGVRPGRPSPAPSYRYAAMGNMTLSVDKRFSAQLASLTPQNKTRSVAVSSYARGSFEATGGVSKGARTGGRGGRAGSNKFLGDRSADDVSYGAVTPAPQTANEKVHAIIELQDFEGWWESSDALSAILQVEVPTSQTKEWVTMLVVKWLEVRMKAEGEVWELVVEKARGWLEGQVMGEGEMERLEREVDGLVK
ncbi:MAG: hypothetical protein Q9208_006341 [Pyrenodesmia sp. 3 TL-2023]